MQPGTGVRLEELSQFAAAPPPRRIPPAIRRARLPAAPITVALIVAAAVVVGTWPLVSAAFPDRLIDDLRLDLGSPALTVGTVESVEASGRSLIRRDAGVDVDVPIRRVRFRFRPGDGELIEGTSFAYERVPEPTQEVGVQYLASDPEVARIVDSTLSSTPRIGALVLLMPAIAVAWLLKVFAQRRRVRRLLVNGRFEVAEIVELREHRPLLGSARLGARLRTETDDVLEAEFGTSGRDAALLRARAAGTGRVGLLRDERQRTRFLLTESMLVAPAAAETGDDEADEEEEEEEDDEELTR